MDRRKFITQSGILLCGLQLARQFKQDLIGELSHQILPQAHGAEIQPKRVLELTFRSGIPLIIFGAGYEFSRLSQPRYSNFSYAGNEIVKAKSVSNLYLNMDSASLLPHSQNMAITQGVAPEGGHTGLFNYREGGRGKRKTTPIVELASLNTTQSLVNGVQWPGSVQNQANNLPNLTRVTGESFRKLFKNDRLKLSSREVAAVLNTAKKISRRQALLLEDHMTESLSQFKSYNKGMSMFDTDYSQLLDLSSLPGHLQPMGIYSSYKESLGLTLKAFEHNLINSSLVTIELGDWHRYQNNKQNSTIIKNISQIISATIDQLKRTPDVAAGNGKTLWDTTTVVVGSEFNRGIAPFSRDNSDGQTQGVLLIGKNIKGNYYGGFTLYNDARRDYGKAHGFDPQTGKTTPGANNSTEQLYYTVKAALNLHLSTTEREKVLQAMLG